MKPAIHWAFCIVGVLISLPVAAKFRSPEFIPAERLIANTKAHLAEHPRDANAHYTMARIHYLAFVNESDLVGVIGVKKEETLPRVAPDWRLKWREEHLRREEARQWVLEKRKVKSEKEIPADQRKRFWKSVQRRERALKYQGWKPAPLTPDAAKKHAEEALRFFASAIQMDPTNALYHLGQASLIEQYVEITSEKPALQSNEFKAIGQREAITAYLRAYELAIHEDLKLKHLPSEGIESLIGHEAGKGFLRVVKEVQFRIRAEYKDEVNAVKESLAKLGKLRYRALTPIVFSLQQVRSLQELLAPEKSVLFDLDGDDQVESWPWLKSTTALLVWDPGEEGSVTSGRQLFGTYTFSIFWSDGYAALRALDNDRDGELTGEELKGLSAWFDRDQNGCSEWGEVVPLEALGVEAIATASDGTEDGQPRRSDGLRLASGDVLPTWDWIPRRP